MNGRFERWVEDERRCWRAAIAFSGLAHLGLLGAYALHTWLGFTPARAEILSQPIEVEVVALTAADLEQLLTRTAPTSGSGFARPDSRRAASRMAGPRPLDIDSLLPPDPSRIDVPQSTEAPGAMRMLEANSAIGTEKSLYDSRRRRRVEMDLDLLAEIVTSEQAVQPGADSGEGQLLEAQILTEDLARSICKLKVMPRDEERWRQLGMDGVGLFEFRIDAEGLVSAVDVITSTGYRELDLAGIEALQAWQFDTDEMDRVRAPYRYRQRFMW